MTQYYWYVNRVNGKITEAFGIGQHIGQEMITLDDEELQLFLDNTQVMST